MNLSWDESRVLYLLALHNCHGKHLFKLKSAYETVTVGIKDSWSKLDSRLVKKLQIIDFFKITEYSELFITCVDKKYPQELLIIEEYPLVLWYRGNLEVLQLAKLSIVGSRAITPNTQYFLQSIVPTITKANIAIVSGLALGVDSYAHQVSVENHGVAIAVLGGGIDDASFSPKTNLTLRNAIIEAGGLIVTQFPPRTVPAVYTFPIRNKLVAALSTVILVAQAEHNSGTMITAQLALNMKKIVCTPSVDYFENSVSGNRELIQKGVQVIVQAQDILHDYNHSANSTLNKNNAKLMSSAEIGEYFGIAKELLLTELTMLEMSGTIEKVGMDQFYVVG